MEPQEGRRSPPMKRIRLESQGFSRSPSIVEVSPLRSPSVVEVSPSHPMAQSQEQLHQDDSETDGEHCSICLQPVVDRTVVPTCSHEFCFECLLLWTEQSRRCPLCSQTIGDYLIHHIRSKYDYQKHYLTPLRSSRSISAVVAAQRDARRRAQTRREREWGRRQRKEQEEADELERAIEKRKWVYRHHLYAKHVASNPYTRYRPFPTPAQFTASPDLISRATVFLRRELRVWVGLDVEFLTTFTVSLMKSLDIRSEPAVRLLAEFLDMDNDSSRVKAEHFAHELYSYLRSPYRDLAVYDSVVQYDNSEHLPPPAALDQGRRWRSQSRSRSRSRSVSVHPRSRSQSRPYANPRDDSRPSSRERLRAHQLSYESRPSSPSSYRQINSTFTNREPLQSNDSLQLRSTEVEPKRGRDQPLVVKDGLSRTQDNGSNSREAQINGARGQRDRTVQGSKLKGKQRADYCHASPLSVGERHEARGPTDKRRIPQHREHEDTRTYNRPGSSGPLTLAHDTTFPTEAVDSDNLSSEALHRENEHSDAHAFDIVQPAADTPIERKSHSERLKNRNLLDSVHAHLSIRGAFLQTQSNRRKHITDTQQPRSSVGHAGSARNDPNPGVSASATPSLLLRLSSPSQKTSKDHSAGPRPRSVESEAEADLASGALIRGSPDGLDFVVTGTSSAETGSLVKSGIQPLDIAEPQRVESSLDSKDRHFLLLRKLAYEKRMNADPPLTPEISQSAPGCQHGMHITTETVLNDNGGRPAEETSSEASASRAVFDLEAKLCSQIRLRARLAAAKKAAMGDLNGVDGERTAHGGIERHIDVAVDLSHEEDLRNRLAQRRSNQYLHHS